MRAASGNIWLTLFGETFVPGLEARLCGQENDVWNILWDLIIPGLATCLHCINAFTIYIYIYIFV